MRRRKSLSDSVIVLITQFWPQKYSCADDLPGVGMLCQLLSHSTLRNDSGSMPMKLRMWRKHIGAKSVNSNGMLFAGSTCAADGDCALLSSIVRPPPQVRCS